MARMHTKEEFVENARARYGEKYDYSEVEYKGNHIGVIIICKKHGRFTQTPHDHLQNKVGCKKCAMEERHKMMVCGVGFNDTDFANTEESYRTWRAMLNRCYRSVQNSYIGCSVCDDWLLFSKFKKWFDSNHIAGYALDKDIIKKGNRVYCPEYCCFVPRRINNILTKNKKGRGDLPIGVTKRASEHTYLAVLNIGDGIRKKIGRYETPTEAFFAYKQAKESLIQQVAQEYFENGLISERIYDALMRYEVEITD